MNGTRLILLLLASIGIVALTWIGRQSDRAAVSRDVAASTPLSSGPAAAVTESVATASPTEMTPHIWGALRKTDAFAAQSPVPAAAGETIQSRAVFDATG